MATSDRELLKVWLAAGSALAYMVTVGWLIVARRGVAPAGDMIGHAAAAEWLRALPWWDWRGWSDWFYGGQAMGVNYPPLGHAWMRLTDPVHGQMAAVLVGLVVLLPWGTVALARAVGLDRRRQGAALALVMALAAWSAEMQWTLSSFHIHEGFFGSWPKMLAPVVCLFAAARAARGRAPVAAGAVVGVAALLNASVVPGVAIVCAVLLATSGLRLSQLLRWAATASAVAILLSAWWLVPFLAGGGRLVRWDVSLRDAWVGGGPSSAVVLAAVGAGAVVAARHAAPSRRLALAAAVTLVATATADLAGYLRPERWLVIAILVAATAAAGAVPTPGRTVAPRLARTSTALAGSALVAGLAVVLARPEVLALAVALVFWRPGRTWVWGGALAWFAVLLWIPMSDVREALSWESDDSYESVSYSGGDGDPDSPASLVELLTRLSGPGTGGTLHIDGQFQNRLGNIRGCHVADPWSIAKLSGGRLRPLQGLYRETSATAEFIEAGLWLEASYFGQQNSARPHWPEAWLASGRPSLGGAAAAEALGARWFLECDDNDGTATVWEGSVAQAEGVTVLAHDDEESWHRAAVQWWVAVASESAPLRPGGAANLPVLWKDVAVGSVGRSDQPAAGVSLETAQDRLFVTAESAGWVWLRVPWDPDWRTADGRGAVLKGGPGHLVVWVEPGVTELRWEIPDAVDLAAAAVTAAALLLTVAMASINRRKGWEIDPDRPRPVTEGLNRFADAADRQVVAAGQAVGSAARRTLASSRRPPDPTVPDTSEDTHEAGP